MAGEAAVPEGGGGEAGVGAGLEEVAAEGEEDFAGLAVHGEDGLYGIVAVLAGRGDAGFAIEGGEEGFGHFLEDADGAVALNIGVAAHGTESGARGGQWLRGGGGYW